MRKSRTDADCAVFEGRIVVSGGMGNNNNDEVLNGVESYDSIGNNWSSMPNMVYPESLHSLVIVRNKLFVIGSGKDRCEVFDNTCKKFVHLKSSLGNCGRKIMSLGNEIIIFVPQTDNIICFNVDTNEWSEVPCEAMKYLDNFFWVKFPWFKGS